MASRQPQRAAAAAKRAQGTRAAFSAQCAIGEEKKGIKTPTKKTHEALRFDAAVGAFSSDGLSVQVCFMANGYVVLFAAAIGKIFTSPGKSPRIGVAITNIREGL